MLIILAGACEAAPCGWDDWVNMMYESPEHQPYTGFEQTGWKCVNVTKLANVTIEVPPEQFKVGDCIFLNDTDKAISDRFFKKGINTTFRMPKTLSSFSAKSYGTWTPTAGCGSGSSTWLNALKLLDTTEIDTDNASKVDPPITCPEGQTPIMTVNDTDQNRCTAAYGGPDDAWSKYGGLCYPKCRSGFVPNGPDCWADCPSNMHDDGVDCRKHTYQPSLHPQHWGGRGRRRRACRRRQQKYGLECIDACRDGYRKYNDGLGYYCAPPCPSEHFADAGLTCTKGSYGRGFGKLLPGTLYNWLEMAFAVAVIIIAAAVAYFSGGGLAVCFSEGAAMLIEEATIVAEDMWWYSSESVLEFEIAPRVPALLSLST